MCAEFAPQQFFFVTLSKDLERPLRLEKDELVISHSCTEGQA